jgi:hypothetical protein
VAQVVESLASKLKALSSNSSTTPKKLEIKVKINEAIYLGQWLRKQGDCPTSQSFAKLCFHSYHDNTDDHEGMGLQEQKTWPDLYLTLTKVPGVLTRHCAVGWGQ